LRQFRQLVSNCNSKVEAAGGMDEVNNAVDDSALMVLTRPQGSLAGHIAKKDQADARHIMGSDLDDPSEHNYKPF